MTEEISIVKKTAAVFLAILLPFSLILALPLYLWRYLVSFLARLVYWKKIRGILSTGSSLYAIDDIYNFPKSAILVGITLEGRLTVEELQQSFQTRIINSQLPNSIELRYPELKEYVFPWFGYVFWRREDEFKIEEHVMLCDAVPNEDAVFQFGISRVHSAFPAGKSPWEWLLVHHTETEHCTVLLRIHHALGDGLSIIKMFNLMVDGGKIPLPKPGHATNMGIFRRACLPMLAAYELSLQSLQPLDENSWHLPLSKLLRKPNATLSLPIPLKDIKAVKDVTGSSFAGVVLTAFACGLRQFMLDNEFVVPEKITAAASLPFPGHPDKMRNHLTAIFVPLPLGEMKPRKRLAAIEKSFEELRQSNLPIGSFYGLKLNGALPVPFIRRTVSAFSPTAGFANFPGPSERVGFGNRKITSIWAGGGFPQRAGVTCCSISYSEDFRLAISIDDAIVPKTVPASVLVQLIIKQIYVLGGPESEAP